MATANFNTRENGTDFVFNTNANKGMNWLVNNKDYKGEDCLYWPYGTYRKGYGAVWYKGKSRIASRIMCEMAHGTPPTSKHQAAHSCGNGHLGCTNPMHLRWALNKENHNDRIGHGTIAKGSDVFGAVLTERDVKKIRDETGKTPVSTLAALFGVTTTHIYNVQNKKRWQWVD